MKTWMGLAFVMGICLGHGNESIQKISLPLIPDIQRADLYVVRLTDHPAAVLVLCPGCNGNGKGWVTNPKWQAFARENRLDLMGLSFASDQNLLNNGRGYYCPSQGSGQLLLDGIDRVYGKDLPLLLYGFSGGAHFTSGFAEWRPERVWAWCAYSAGWWCNPVARNHCPPGLIICGENDQRYGATLVFFKQGRALAKPWLWISAPKTGHEIYPPEEDFIRKYFAVILRNGGGKTSGEWVDIDLKTIAGQETLQNMPSVTGWLPDGGLFADWSSVHHP